MTVVGSQEPPWAAVLPPARITFTSCVLVLRSVCFSWTGRCTASNTRILSVQRYGHISPPQAFFYFYYSHPHTCWFSLHCIDLWFAVLFQMVSGKGFEVARRVYVDFEGINLRRKFLTGLEPESINMTIGKNICLLVYRLCGSIKRWNITAIYYQTAFNVSPFLSHFSRLSADSETGCVVRAVVNWEDAVSCRLSVSAHCHYTASLISEYFCDQSFQD